MACLRIRRAFRPIAACAALFAAGCTTQWTMIAPEVPESAERLGPACGESYRQLLLGTPSYNLIPIGWDQSIARAYDRAVASVPGANALSGVTVEEDWFFWGLGSARHLLIDGEGVRR